MQIELLIFSFVIVAYGTFTTLAIIGLGKLKRIPESLFFNTPGSFISIIISARNEEKNIEECLSQIEKQNFPKENFELIIVDDASNDATFQLAKQFLEKSSLNFQIIQQKEHQGKKKNIANAIELSKGDIIITSDADVSYRNQNWLLTISNYFRIHNPNLLIMPVDFVTQRGILPAFQIIENIALTGITAGYTGTNKPFMCNGANLAFKKTVYHNINGYESHMHISSGEDVFLLEGIKKLPESSIHYFLSRELIVKTKPQTSIKDFFNQRIRWAYKAKYNPNGLNMFAGIIIVLANFIFMALFVAILKKSVFIPYLSIFAVAKLLFDFLLLFLASVFLGRVKYIWWLIPFECIYWLYALTIGTASLFLKPYWKGKKIS